MFEASMNFDLENVAPFLNRLNDHLKLELPVEALVEFTGATAVEDDRSRTIEVKHEGDILQLEYRVFMDDIDAPDLYFFTTSERLAAAIEQQLDDFADELGI